MLSITTLLLVTGASVTGASEQCRWERIQEWIDAEDIEPRLRTLILSTKAYYEPLTEAEVAHLVEGLDEPCVSCASMCLSSSHTFPSSPEEVILDCMPICVPEEFAAPCSLRDLLQTHLNADRILRELFDYTPVDDDSMVSDDPDMQQQCDTCISGCFQTLVSELNPMDYIPGDREEEGAFDLFLENLADVGEEAFTNALNEYQQCGICCSGIHSEGIDCVDVTPEIFPLEGCEGFDGEGPIPFREKRFKQWWDSSTGCNWEEQECGRNGPLFASRYSIIKPDLTTEEACLNDGLVDDSSETPTTPSPVDSTPSPVDSKTSPVEKPSETDEGGKTSSPVGLIVGISVGVVVLIIIAGFLGAKFCGNTNQQESTEFTSSHV